MPLIKHALRAGVLIILVLLAAPAFTEPVEIDDSGLCMIPPRPRQPEEIMTTQQKAGLDLYQDLYLKKHPQGLRTSLDKVQAVTGTKKAVTILIDFSDKVAQTPKTHCEQLLFSVNTHPTGSLRDYYREASYTLADITGIVTDWYRAPQPYAWYVQNLFGVYSKYPQNVQGLTEDAIRLADADIDFSQYDNDGPDGVPNSGDDDGFVDQVFIVHAGPGAEFTLVQSDIWSHKYQTFYPVSVDGVKVSIYTMEPEDGTIGVYCHELGHAFGLPDLYDYDYDSAGLGYWCLMAAGVWGFTGSPGGDTAYGTKPAHFSAWCKTKLGWMTPRTFTTNQSDIILGQASSLSDCLRLWRNGPGDKEYFLVENRQQANFDVSIPAGGLLVYHCDDNIPTNDNQEHYRVAVVEADAGDELKFDILYGGNYGDSGDPFPGSSGKFSWSDATIPNSRDYGGSYTGVSLTNISPPGSFMNFNMTCVDTTTGNHPPSIVVVEPSNRILWFADTVFRIKWVATDGDNHPLTITLYYDTDNDPAVKTLIQGGLPNTGFYDWNCSAVPPGVYYIHAVVNDGNGGIRSAYSPQGDLNFNTFMWDGTLAIDHGAGDTFEPNDLPTQAVAVNPTSITNSKIYIPYDVDIYKVNLTGAGQMTIDLTQIPVNTDYDVRVFDPTLRLIAWGTSGNAFVNPIVNGPEHVVFNNTLGGDHYIVVDGHTVEDIIYSYDMNANYRLALSYSLQATFTPGPTATRTPTRTYTPGPSPTPAPTGTPTPAPTPKVRILPANVTLHHPPVFLGVGGATQEFSIRVEDGAGVFSFSADGHFTPNVVMIQNATDVVPGEYLNFADGPPMFASPNINNPAGTWFIGTANWTPPGAFGNGDLALVTWTTMFTDRKKTATLSLTNPSMISQFYSPYVPQLFSAQVTVCFYADIDCNDRVDIVDVQQVAGRWNTVQGGPNYDARSDVDKDGDIDIIDIQLVAGRWGQVAPFAP